jgi:hypothetical protein
MAVTMTRDPERAKKPNRKAGTVALCSPRAATAPSSGPVTAAHETVWPRMPDDHDSGAAPTGLTPVHVHMQGDERSEWAAAAEAITAYMDGDRTGWPV